MRAENPLEFQPGVDFRKFKLLPFVMGNEKQQKIPPCIATLVAKQIDTKIERYRFGAARKHRSTRIRRGYGLGSRRAGPTCVAIARLTREPVLGSR